MSTRTILWDFDGTLAYREGLWSGCLAEVIEELAPELKTSREALRPHLQHGFPWHRPDEPHPHLTDASAWWTPIEELLAEAAVSVGASADLASRCARQTRLRYIDGTGFRVFDDVVPTLSSLKEAGWRHSILSNHVPELEAIVEAVGLAPFVSRVFSSAITGFEKPNPEAYRIARDALGDPDEIWMIGDNPWADALGAEAVGIPAILVREAHPDVRLQAADLYQAMEYL